LWLAKKVISPSYKHLELLEQVHELSPSHAKVIFLGFGPFDGIKLLAALKKHGWQYVCKTSQNSHIHTKFFGKISFEDCNKEEGQCVCLLDKAFTRRKVSKVLAGAKLPKRLSGASLSWNSILFHGRCLLLVQQTVSH
jgi:hypothetical protein